MYLSRADLSVVAVLEEFLHDIIAKHVDHQWQRTIDNLVEHEQLLGRRRLLELLLNEARTELIAREFDDVTFDVAEPKALRRSARLVESLLHTR